MLGQEKERKKKKARTTHLSRFIELNRVPFIVLHDTIISLLNFRFSYLLQDWISVSFFYFSRSFAGEETYGCVCMSVCVCVRVHVHAP